MTPTHQHMTESAVNFVFNHGVAHTNRDSPAWHYDLIAHKSDDLIAYKSGYTECFLRDPTVLLLISTLKSLKGCRNQERPCPQCVAVINHALAQYNQAKKEMEVI